MTLKEKIFLIKETIEEDFFKFYSHCSLMTDKCLKDMVLDYPYNENPYGDLHLYFQARMAASLCYYKGQSFDQMIEYHTGRIIKEWSNGD